MPDKSRRVNLCGNYIAVKSYAIWPKVSVTCYREMTFVE